MSVAWRIRRLVWDSVTLARAYDMRQKGQRLEPLPFPFFRLAFALGLLVIVITALPYILREIG